MFRERKKERERERERMMEVGTEGYREVEEDREKERMGRDTMRGKDRAGLREGAIGEEGNIIGEREKKKR